MSLLRIRSVRLPRSIVSFPPVRSISHLRPWTRPTGTRHPQLTRVAFARIRHYSQPPKPPSVDSDNKPTIRENIYTIPNLLTLSRIAACPVLGWSIVKGDFHLATGLLVYAGITDLLDGFLARRYNMQSVLGTILDPAADKTLMTTLVVTLAWKGLLPMPLAVIILGRDVLLSLSAFYIRYTSLPPPKTFQRYWDFSIPSAEVHPTLISKVNTALQLVLMGTTTMSPVIPVELGVALQGLQWLVATTTIWSGLSYIYSKDAVKIVTSSRKPKP
ncbi:CDP-alcohol phosphatidyltransferase-domain-containing protein [Flagelloscypha sp. PMI_526]|nr:CDP-alcohol phosphatidyltransferase-domain-containing protein [Flagelloscypha sp. PMI_526]